MTSGSSQSKNTKYNDDSYRRFLSQFVATTVKNLLMIDTAFFFALPAIMIPALTGMFNEHNRNEFLTITSVQASFVGSLGFIIKPIGSLISGLITDTLGRKRTMIFVNIPFAIGWYTLYQSSAVWHLFLGIAFLGLAVGLMEAAVVSYIGEICEPKYRGVLIGYTYISYSLGMFVTFFLNTLMPWRMVCLCFLAMPVLTAIAMLFIPETPYWLLLSKNRMDQAENSLRWIRGWASSEHVAQEFLDLQRHIKVSKSCNTCIAQKCIHSQPTLREKLTEFKRKRVLKPLFITISVIFLSLYPGIVSLKPYMVQIFKAYDSPISADRAVAMMSILDALGSVIFVLLVRFTGKRRLYLFCLSGAIICSAILTWFGFTYLPTGHISFAQAEREPFHLENKSLGYIPIVCLLTWSHLAYICLAQFPWILLSEMFPFKLRGIANGILSAILYISIFCATKAYYNLENLLSLPGVSLVYTLIGLFGLILTYNILPETENRSLEDIELHFSDNSKGFTSTVISKYVSNEK